MQGFAGLSSACVCKPLKRGISSQTVGQFSDYLGPGTRNVITVLQKIVGQEIIIYSTQISHCTALLDTLLGAWRNRLL